MVARYANTNAALQNGKCTYKNNINENPTKITRDTT